jgi:uncharacterized phage protein (TIGR02220 family)
MSQIEKIQKKFDSIYKNFKFDSEFQKETAFGYFKEGFVSSEDLIKKADGKYKESASLVLDYFNSEKKKIPSYKNTRGVKFTTSVEKIIVARLKEDFSIDDLKMVVDYKLFRWKGTDMEQYLRPSTLFSAKKFPEYLAESEHYKKPVRSSIDTKLQNQLIGG